MSESLSIGVINQLDAVHAFVQPKGRRNPGWGRLEIVDPDSGSAFIVDRQPIFSATENKGIWHVISASSLAFSVYEYLTKKDEEISGK